MQELGFFAENLDFSFYSIGSKFIDISPFQDCIWARKPLKFDNLRNEGSKKCILTCTKHVKILIIPNKINFAAIKYLKNQGNR